MLLEASSIYLISFIYLADLFVLSLNLNTPSSSSSSSSFKD
jgi:hypothetical protein